MPRRSTLALLFLLLARCGDEDRTQTEYTPSNDRTSTSSDDTTAAPARAVPWPDTLPATLPPQDTFAVTLAQGAGGATYEGAVRQGSCARMGATVASLVPATADSLGGGRASSDVPVPVDSLTGAPHVLVYGRGGGRAHAARGGHGPVGRRPRGIAVGR